MKNSKVKTPDPVVADPTLESQMKNLAETTRTALARVEDVRVEQVKKTGQAGKNGGISPCGACGQR